MQSLFRVLSYAKLPNRAILPKRTTFIANSFLLLSSARLFSQANASTPIMSKSEEEWRKTLSSEEYYVLRQKGTERPFVGKYDKHFENGIYNCAGCGTPLYKSNTKFDSGCGWPAFWDAIPGAVTEHEDRSHGMLRTEITCTKCGGHLGHVFKGERHNNPKDERHCVNSISIKFEKQ